MTGETWGAEFASGLAGFVEAWRVRLAAARQRGLLILPGARETVRRAAAGLTRGASLELAERAVPARRALGWLGRELDTVIFDAFDGFEADAFGALSGTLRAGGLLVLLCPPLDDWPDWPDPARAALAVAGVAPEAVGGRFLGRLVRVLRADPAVVLAPDGRSPSRLPAPPPAPVPPAAGDPDCLSEDQARAAAAVLRAGRGRARRPVVLTADRGRGKSAALGIAAARLLAAGRGDVAVTAPVPASCEQVFVQAARLLSGARRHGNELEYRGLRLRFLAPDALARTAPEGIRLVLVDEAAAIPAPLLRTLLLRFPRIAFASTVHGYEGTGRGFALRFRQALDRHRPGWKALRLATPIRWAAGDGLERVVGEALLLDAEPAPDAALAAAGPDSVAYARLERAALAADEPLLRELFGLLVLAHYRTRPFDLRMLLDAPNVSVHVLRHAGHVAATALLAAEGGLPGELAEDIRLGRRRPHGHLLPETLVAHQGLAEAAGLRGLRVVRIAVHPAAQGRGLGRRLLEILAVEAGEGADYLGSCFGAEAGLLRFWRRAGCEPVRLGISRGASTGEHAVAVLRPLSPAGRALFRAARARFADQLPVQLADALRGLEPALAAEALAGLPLQVSLSAADRRDLEAFAHGHRLFETVLAPAKRLALLALREGRVPEAPDLAVLVSRVLQHRDWPATAQACGAAGRAAAVRRLRRVVAGLLAEAA